MRAHKTYILWLFYWWTSPDMPTLHYSLKAPLATKMICIAVFELWYIYLYQLLLLLLFTICLWGNFKSFYCHTQNAIMTISVGFFLTCFCDLLFNWNLKIDRRGRYSITSPSQKKFSSRFVLGATCRFEICHCPT